MKKSVLFALVLVLTLTFSAFGREPGVRGEGIPLTSEEVSVIAQQLPASPEMSAISANMVPLPPVSNSLGAILEQGINNEKELVFLGSNMPPGVFLVRMTFSDGTERVTQAFSLPEGTNGLAFHIWKGELSYLSRDPVLFTVFYFNEKVVSQTFLYVHPWMKQMNPFIQGARHENGRIILTGSFNQTVRPRVYTEWSPVPSENLYFSERGLEIVLPPGQFYGDVNVTVESGGWCDTVSVRVLPQGKG